MGGANRLALAAAQAVLDGIGNRADIRLLHDQRLMSHKTEAGRIGAAQVALRHQLVPIEVPLGIDALLVAAKCSEFRVGKIFELGDADPVFTGDHAVQGAGDAHDPRHRAVRGVQHGVVVGIDRNVGVHIAVAGVHVQRDEHAALQDALVNGIATLEYRRKGAADKNPGQRRPHLGLPADPNASVLQPVEYAARVAVPVVHVVEQVLPTRADAEDQVTGFGRARRVAVRGTARGAARGAVRSAFAGKIVLQGSQQFELVADGQFDVDTFDGIRVLTQALQWNDHVFVDLEGNWCAWRSRPSWRDPAKIFAARRRLPR